MSESNQKWLADVERTARSVKRQNQCGANRAVELDADEVLKLVAGYRRSSDETAAEPPVEHDDGAAFACGGAVTPEFAAGFERGLIEATIKEMRAFVHDRDTTYWSGFEFALEELSCRLNIAWDELPTESGLKAFALQGLRSSSLRPDLPLCDLVYTFDTVDAAIEGRKLIDAKIGLDTGSAVKADGESR